MQVTKWIFALALILFFISIDIKAQPSPVYHHWVSLDQVYIWGSLSDLRWVTAKLVGNEWKLSPESVRYDQLWLEKLKAGPLRNVATDRLWEEFLTRIRYEIPDDDWAKPRYPDVEIYFRIQSLDSVNVTFIRDGALTTYLFKRQGEMWKKGENIKLSDLLGLGPDSNDFPTVFKTDRIPKTTADWPSFWDEWIKGVIHAPDRIRPVMYTNSKGTIQWLWQERMEEKDWARRIRRQMNYKPDILVREIREEVPIYNWGLPLIVGILLGGTLTSVGVGWRWISKTRDERNLMQRKQIWSRIQFWRGESVELPQETPSPTERSVYGVALEKAYSEYKKIFDENLRQLIAQVEKNTDLLTRLLQHIDN